MPSFTTLTFEKVDVMDLIAIAGATEVKHTTIQRHEHGFIFIALGDVGYCFDNDYAYQYMPDDDIERLDVYEKLGRRLGISGN